MVDELFYWKTFLYKSKLISRLKFILMWLQWPQWEMHLDLLCKNRFSKLSFRSLVFVRQLIPQWLLSWEAKLLLESESNLERNLDSFSVLLLLPIRWQPYALVRFYWTFSSTDSVKIQGSSLYKFAASNIPFPTVLWLTKLKHKYAIYETFLRGLYNWNTELSTFIFQNKLQLAESIK